MTRPGFQTSRLLASTLFVLVAVAVSACSIAPPHAAAVGLTPLPPAALGASHRVRQVLYAAFGEHDVAFQCVVDATSEQVTLVGLNALGQRWFSLRHDGHRLESERSPQAPAALDPQRILVDLQLALWPLAAWQQALAGSEWQVTEVAPATRRLRRDGQLVAEVHYAGADPWQGRLWLSNFEHGYSLTVESQPLP